MTLFVESLALNVVTVLTTLFIGLYIYITRNFNFWKKLGVPYIKPTPFVGNMKELIFQQTSIGQYLKQIYEEHGDKACVGIFSFDQPGLVIRDLDLVKSILVKDAQHFTDRISHVNETLDPMFGRNLFSLKGQPWRNLRVKLTPVFTSGKMKTMFCLVDNCSKELLHYLHKEAADGSPVNLREAMARFTTDVISSCGFGIESNSLKDPDAEFRHYLRRVVELTISKGLAGLAAFFSPALNTIFRLRFIDNETTDFLRKTVWSTVEYREKNGVIRKDFLDSLMNLRSNGKENNTTKNSAIDFHIDGDDFVAQAFIFLAAGFETSSSTMSFALYELALHPDCQHRLRAEITQVLSKHQGEVTYDGLQEMSYLDMVVSETLRKYPILPFLDRRCVKDYEFQAPSGKGTVTLPAGIGVYIPVMGIQHNPEYYPEPDKFDPERFTDENKRRRPNYTYLPFGEGPRNCIGMRFGLMQAKTGLIHILSHYEVTSCKDTPVPLLYDLKSFLMTVKGEIPLYFKKVNCDATSDAKKIK